MTNNLKVLARQTAARPALTVDEREAWEQLFVRLDDYSSAVSALEQATLRWLKARDEAMTQESVATSSLDLAGARVEMAEAACALARRRCAEALLTLQAFETPAGRPTNLVPWPVVAARVQPPRLA